ncbi:MAG: DUF6132 family protein [Elusimicrobiales bacterium]|nr:DUF6132 family protein [Elusimicrobiales bacterium]
MYVLKVISGAAAGGMLGYLWHRLVGCSSGACPIVKSPYMSAIWGALMGFLFTINR